MISAGLFSFCSKKMIFLPNLKDFRFFLRCFNEAPRQVILVMITFSYHARIRMHQRGITDDEVVHILQFPIWTRHNEDGTRTVYGQVKNRSVLVVVAHKEKHIRIVTVR